MNRILKGNILDIQNGVIIHQVNAQKKMNAGLAKEIRAKYPSHYNDYMNTKLTLGSLVKTKISNKFAILGLVGQENFGRNPSTVYTDYPSFELALIEIQKPHSLNPKVKYYMPFKIGCGLANGNWDTISKLIFKHCPFITLIQL